MNKYDALWQWVGASGESCLRLSYEDIRRISGVPIDHSFLRYKKELTEYGYEVEKISMKENAVLFRRISE